jgi:hypothetical protein
VINKADSIEEENEKLESECVSLNKKSFSCSDEVMLEEEMKSERKRSVVAMETTKSIEVDDTQLKQQLQPIEALLLPPTSISTQTIPTEEFPEVSVTTTAINQADDVGKIAQLNVETQQHTKIAQEIDRKSNELRKMCSRSMTDKGESMTVDTKVDDDSAKARLCEEQQKKQQRLLENQQSMSQEEDCEVARFSGLLPGCVAPAPTPAPELAPLAEGETDPTEEDADIPGDQSEAVEPKPEVERKKKRKEKREKEGETQSQPQLEGESSTDPQKSKRNAVCPWEDE